ncbi:hypothetical protein V7146_20515 [Gottfriedia acidiceleris]|uniref:hypothetical protein n=1 Tax=Gottfriedia acidiceleris TaxID=371036 RepID=UPI002FFDBA89
MFEITIKNACTKGFWECLSPTDWIQIVSIFLSFVSVVIALIATIASLKSAKASKIASQTAEKQLEETYNQRKDSIRPEIFINSDEYLLTYKSGKVIGQFYKSIEDLNGNIVDSNLYLNLSNIGEGHAKNIHMNWSLNLSEHVAFIMKHQENKQYIVDYQESKRLDFNESSSIYLEKELEISHPIFKRNEKYDIKIPYLYSRILSIFIHILMKMEHEKSELLGEKQLPKIKLSISYFDVLKNPFYSEYMITPIINQLDSSTQDGEISVYNVKAILEVNELVKGQS